MSARFPVWPPQRLPRPVIAEWTDAGAVTSISGVNGFTIYNGSAATWTGKEQVISAPSTINFVAARMAGGHGLGTAEFGIYMKCANKTILWLLEDNTSYLYYRYATSAWPPGAFETTLTSTVSTNQVGPFLGFWVDRTVSPPQIKPLYGLDCYQNPTAGQAPLGMFVWSGNNPTIGGGGANDVGAPVSWGIAYLNTAATVGVRLTVNEVSQGAFYSGDEDSSNIEGRSLVFGSTLNQRLSFPPDRGGHRHGNR